MLVRIAEIFYSISGEGMTAGIPTIFIRLAGCSLRCGMTGSRKLWCDTGYALSFQAGEEKSLEFVLDWIEKTNPHAQIIFTGGEPLEGEKKRKFCAVLSQVLWDKRHNGIFRATRIETSGSEDIAGLEHSVFTIDYKLPGSGMEDRMLSKNFHLIRERQNPLDEVKFVVRDSLDFSRALEIIETFSLQNTVLLFSPVFTDMENTELAELVKNAKLPKARLSLQIHKILWGERRGV